jgi:lipase chaperone LimK
MSRESVFSAFRYTSCHPNIQRMHVVRPGFDYFLSLLPEKEKQLSEVGCHVFIVRVGGKSYAKRDRAGRSAADSPQGKLKLHGPLS